ncbi:hypothetical protein K8I61_06305 [bacterium]|nr:hypothetical protein [bacterium]
MANRTAKRAAKRAWRFAVLAALPLLVFLTGFALWNMFGVGRDVSIEIDLDVGDDAPGFLFFPSGSRPEIRSVRLENAGRVAFTFPRLIVNNENRYGSVKEILAQCAEFGDNTVALLACANEFLHRHLEHYHGWTDELEKGYFTKSLGQALFYDGYSQCGPSSSFLAEIAQRLGLRACTIGLDGHVVAEIFLGDESYLFDPDTNQFFTDDYRSIASFQRLRKGDLFANTPNRLRIQDISRWNARWRLRNRAEYHCGKIDAESFPLASWALEPGDALTFFPDKVHGNAGCRVTMTRTLVGSGAILIELPYPGIETVVRAPKDAPAFRMTAPRGVEIDPARGPARIPLQKVRRTPSREHFVEFFLPEPIDASADFTMRYACGSIPQLREGPNRVEVEGTDLRAPGNARVTFDLRVRSDPLLESDPIRGNVIWKTDFPKN